MSVTIRPYRRGGWEVDIRVVSPDGTRHKRERKHAPISSRSAVGRWAAARERVLFERLLAPQKDHQRKEVPTLQEFAPRFVDGHTRSNRQKPSGIASKTSILRLYLIPAFGRRRLEATIAYYVTFVHDFLADRFGRDRVTLAHLCAGDVVRFVQHQAARLHAQRAKQLTTALRSFLHYARYRGDIVLDLAAAVPTVASWSMSSIPRAIPVDTVR